MSSEIITLSVEPPEVLDIPRVIQVKCGESFVTVKQMDGWSGRKWTVYSNDGAGMSGPVMESPTGEQPDVVLPWARERARLMERERLARKALASQLGDGMPPAQE